MKIFVDLGAYIGDSLGIAMIRYKTFDRFYAFEPLKKSFKELENKFGNRVNVFLINAAADINNEIKKLYLGDVFGDMGCSLCNNKITNFKDKFEMVETIDFSNFVKTNFKLKDKIVLKIDIEGKEYELLDKMLRDGSIRYIHEIYCEWHYDTIGIDYENHMRLIRQLRDEGFNLAGNNRLDEYISCFKENGLRLQLRKYKYYYNLILKGYLKKRMPIIFYCLKGLLQTLKKILC